MIPYVCIIENNNNNNNNNNNGSWIRKNGEKNRIYKAFSWQEKETKLF